MTGLLWLLVLVLLPLILLFILRANAAAVYLSLCLGFVLYFFDSHNASTAAGSLPVHLKSTSLAVNLLLLLGPAVLTMLFMLHSVHGSKKKLNLIPAAFCGLFTALIVVPALPPSIANGILSTSYWHNLSKYQGAVVGIGAVVALAFFWLFSKKKEAKKHHTKD